jgi:fatty-acyl-CoA synthase
VDGEGNHFIVGRRKEMFISGGENVYPAEIEEALLEHPAVADAAVVGIPDERWGEVGLAALVAGDVGEEEIVEFLRGRIARYKVPRRIVFLEDLPRTGAGKVDKRALAREPRSGS